MTTYGNKYIFNFISQNGDEVEVCIQKKNYFGSFVRRPVGRGPVLKRERNGAILGTSLELYAECRIDQEYVELYTSSADEFRVLVYKNRELQWTGFVSPELYAEPDIAPPYDVQIIATDGLGELKNTLFDRPDESYPLGDHIDYILRKTGLSLSVDLISSLSWDDEAHNNSPSSLLSLTANLTHLASNSDYDVLQDILTSFNACITQQAGRWMIVRKTDIYNNIPLFRTAAFGSVNKTTWWPIGSLSADIVPAKRKLTLTHENNYKDSILPGLISGVSGGWEFATGVYYNDLEKAYILSDEDYIIYAMEFPVYPISVPLKLSINARPLFNSSEEDRAVLGYFVELEGTVNGVRGTYYLVHSYDDALGRAVWQWYPERIPLMHTWWREELPEDVEQEVTTVNAVLPLGDNIRPDRIRLIVQNYPIISKYAIAVYDIALAQNDQIRGLKLIAEVGNNARESVETSAVISSSADPMLAETMYGVLRLDGGITSWHTPYNAASDLLKFLAADYAMLTALPAIRYRGTLNVPAQVTPWIPFIFERDNTYYLLETYSYDLLLDELEVELVSIPNSRVSIESETIIEIPAGGLSGSGTVSGGGGSSSGGGSGEGDNEGSTLIVDSEMSDTSENAVQNKVIKAYVDGKAKDAQAAAEQYIQNEVLTDYATTKYVGEREEYLVGYAEELVNALENEINGRGYLTSAAMTNYATKNDIKDFVVKGTTLAHYGITDAMTVRNEQSNVDFNDLTTPGAYTIGGGTNSHNPHNYGTLLTIHGKSSYFIGQIAIQFNGETFVRSKNDQPGADGDYWTDWRTIIDTNNISQYAISQSVADSRYLKLIGGTLTGQLYVETSAGDRYIHSKCDTAHIAFGVGSGGNNRGIFDINDGKWWIVRNNSDYTEIASSTISLRGKVRAAGVLEAESGITLGGATRTSWPTEGIAKNSILLPNNAFDNFGRIQFSQLDNALYAAAHRFNITLNGFDSDRKTVLFNGSYEDSIKVPMGQTATIRIDNNGSYIIAGYPYGKIVLSFYYQSVPASVSVRVYNTYGTPGWYTLSLSEVRGSHGGVFVFDNTAYYGITEIEITITAKADIEAALAEIDWFLTRAELSNLPVVTKFAIDQELYGRLICKGGITLGSKTITSWDEIAGSGGGGNYLPLTGGTIDGTLKVQSPHGHYINFDGFSLTVNAGLYISSGYSLRLDGQGITSWAGLKSILGLGSLAYKDSVAFADIGSKPTTLSGYGITDAVISRTGIEPYESGVGNRMGYSYSSKGWKVDGPAMVWGAPTLNARLNADIGSGDNPGLYLSIYNGTAYQWAQIVTDKNFTQFGVKAGRRYTGAYDDDPKSANDIDYPSMAGFTSHLADVPFPNGNLLTITTNPNLYVGQIAISSSGLISFRSRTETTWTDWQGILHMGNIGTTSLPSLNLNGKTITSWDEIKASGDYLPLVGGTITGALTVNGLLTANSGITLGGETITSWDSLKSGWWYQRLIHATDEPIAIGHLSYINIARTLNSNDNITIEIQNSYAFYMATLIFETGSTIPNFNLIETPGRSLIWENGINVFNNLEPNTIYKIVIDEMYAAVTTYNR